MKLVIAMAMLGSVVTALGTIGCSSRVVDPRPDESPLLDKSKLPARYTVAANYFIDWTRQDPDAKTIAPENLIQSHPVKAGSVAVGQVVSYQGRPVVGVHKSTSRDPLNVTDVRHNDGRGETIAGWPPNTQADAAGKIESGSIVSIVVHTVFGGTAGNPEGEVCTIGTPDRDYRSNSPDGLRRDGSDQPVRTTGGDAVQDLINGLASDGTVVTGPAAKRLQRTTSGAVRWLWPNSTNVPPWACHP